MSAWLAGAIPALEPWQSGLILALYLTYKVVLGGWIVAKAGRSPVWVLVVLIPWAEVIAIWAFAYASWPFVDRAADGEGPAGRA